MILVRYFVIEIFKNQLIILILLFLVCFCLKLVKTLGLNNNISIYSIILYIISSFPDFGKLIIPFSLFLSVLTTFYRLHAHNEILGVYSCAINKSIFIRSMLFCSSIIAVLAIINMFYLLPYSERYRNNMLSEIKNNIQIIEITEKKFQLLFNKHLVLFIDKIQKNKLHYVFVVKKQSRIDNDILGIITAAEGNLAYCNNYSQVITLYKGMYYEIHRHCQIYTDIYVTKFSEHHMFLNRNKVISTSNNAAIGYMFTKNIGNYLTKEELLELNWRFTLLVSIFIMPMMVMLLMINIPCNFLFNVLFSMSLYVFFFVLHIIFRSFSLSMQLNPVIWMWCINFIYFILIFIIYFWKTCYIKVFRRI